MDTTVSTNLNHSSRGSLWIREVKNDEGNELLGEAWALMGTTEIELVPMTKPIQTEPIKLSFTCSLYSVNTPKARLLTRNERKAIIRRVAKDTGLYIQEVRNKHWDTLKTVRTKRQSPKATYKRNKWLRFEQMIERSTPTNKFLKR